MRSDIVLKLERRGLFARRRVLTIKQPPEFASVPFGEFKDPPENLWSSKSGYSEGDVDVEPLSAWLRDCLGAKIREGIRKGYPDEGFLRLIITAAAELQPDMMQVPWELLESPDLTQGLSFSERTTVVRVLEPQAPAPPTNIPGRPLKIGVLWADPDKDIPDLAQHLDDLRQIGTVKPFELEVSRDVEFVDPDAIRASFFQSRPEVVYYIGHVDGESNRKAHLRIGSAGKASPYSLNEFLKLMEEIGPPRVLILNACAAAVGYELNPYLGAALTYARQIDAVVAMQTKITVRAAKQFAVAFFRGLTSNKGLAASMKGGRVAIHRTEPLREKKPSFAPFIPVLVQRTTQDCPVIVDISGINLRRLLLRLQGEMDQVTPYLNRIQDVKLTELFTNAQPLRRVTVVHGTKGAGKTTSIKRALLAHLNEKEFVAGDRYLYHDINPRALGGDESRQVLEVLTDLANQCAPLTDDLRRELLGRNVRAGDALAALAVWLEDAENNGLRYRICLDHLPANLASGIAHRASGMIKAGFLILVSDSPYLEPSWPVEEIEIARLDSSEISAALQTPGIAQEGAEVDSILRFSNGFPYFVAGYLRRRSHPRGQPDNLAKNFLESLEPPLSEMHWELLRFAALCEEPISSILLVNGYSAETLAAVVDDYHLLMKTGMGFYRLPEALREYIQSTFSNPLDLRARAFNGFLDLAEDDKDSQEETKFLMATRWYREAFRHRLEMARLLAEEDPEDAVEKLHSARSVAEELHNRYLAEDQVGAAKSLWEEYMEVRYSLRQYDDRGTDFRYAQCLMRVGEYEEAELRLEQSTVGGEVDPIQLESLFSLSNLIKERGKRGERPRRLKLLQEALEIAHQLEGRTEDVVWLKGQIAGIEHSLGNALGFGQEAQVEESLRHLKQAQELFEELNDPLQFRTMNEQIEVKRYNSKNGLSSEEAEAAKRLLRENLHSLVTREMRFDAIQHFYELGRLEINASQRAKYFQQAFQWAKGSYEPDNWHAAINWRIAQVDANEATFPKVAPYLEEYSAKLIRWHNRAWSRRKRRQALKFLTDGYAKMGDQARALEAAKQAWEVAQEIAKLGEGRNDIAERLRVAKLYGELALANKVPDVARTVAKSISNDPTLDNMSEAEMLQFFATVGEEET